MNNINILVERYTRYIKELRPDVKAIKNPDGSLDLSHALWMLEKMKDKNFTSLTTPGAWISWIQASLYLNGIIHIKHEIDITREVLNRNE